MPAYCHESARLGQRYWHDHRYVCSQANISWLYQLRKQEVQRGIYSRVIADCDLNHHDIMRNDTPGRHLPLLMSTVATVGWLGERYSMAVHASTRAPDQYTASWQTLLSGIQSAAAHVCQSGVMTATPQIHAMDLTLHIGSHGTVDLQPLVDRIPSLPADWAAISGRGANGIGPWKLSVAIVDLYRFLVLRCKFSRIPFEHPFSLLRRGLVHVLAFLIEVRVQLSIQEVEDSFGSKRAPPVHALFGPSSRQRSHHLPLPKIIALKLSEEIHGSRETILRTSGLHKGSSSQLRAAKLLIYREKTSELFEPSNAFWMNHDGSCHGGASMIVGLGFDPIRQCAAYAKPEAQLVMIKRVCADNSRIV